MNTEMYENLRSRGAVLVGAIEACGETPVARLPEAPEVLDGPAFTELQAAVEALETQVAALKHSSAE